MMIPKDIKTPKDFAVWIRELSDHNDYSDGYVLDCILEQCDKFINEETKEPLKDKVNRWLDVLNYFDSDVEECAERNNDMRMYKKYEQAQDEMYNLTKGL